MKTNLKSIALAAAFAGLVGGTAARAQVQHVGSNSALAGILASNSSSQMDVEKHACKGQNSCKGQGGGDKKHWGKNSCKGKGACATDGSKPKM